MRRKAYEVAETVVDGLVRTSIINVGFQTFAVDDVISAVRTTYIDSLTLARKNMVTANFTLCTIPKKT